MTPPSGAPLPEPASQVSAGESGSEPERIRVAVLACPDVADLSAGAFGEIRSYLPGRSVPGVRVDDDAVEVHIVARLGPPLQAIAAQIDDALAPILAGRELRVTVEDVTIPADL